VLCFVRGENHVNPAGGALNIMEPAVLKIALVRPYFTLSKGGAERYAVELARALVALGHSIHVYAHRWDTPEEPGVTYHPVSMPRKPAWLRVLWFDRNVRRSLKRPEYDVVLGMTPFSPQSVYWLGDGLYHVWTRILWPTTALRWMMCIKRAVMAVNLRLEKKILTGATDHFIANSRLVKRQAMRHYGVPEARISVVYPGIDTERFNLGVRKRARADMRQRLGIPNDEVVLLFVSNNFKRKGLDLIIRAMANTEERGRRLRLLVVGSGRVSRFRRLAYRRKVAERVIFAGATQAIEYYYAAADIFVLPTRYDPFAVVCLEAMACGLPVVTTRTNGAAELISDGENGFILESGRMEQRLSACLELLRSGEYCAPMGVQAARVAGQISIRDHVRQLACVLGQAAAARRAQKTPEVAQLTPELAINKSFLSLFQAHQLTSYAALTETSRSTEISYNRDKRIYIFSLPEHKTSHGFFLKRHRSHGSRLRAHLGRFGYRGITAGMREWRNLLEFHSRGLPAVTPVAVGERLLPGGTRESFVITLALDSYAPLDQYIAGHFAPPLDEPQRNKKRLLIEAVARLTHDMHWAGFNHRDYYLCHIFARELDDGCFDLKLIDLQRAGYRMFPVRRWFVKDLAQLHYSSLAVPLSNEDRLRFFAVYMTSEKRRTLRRKRLRQVLRKSRAIGKHDAKLRRLGPERVAEDYLAAPHR
jgi:UDP-glucose:(heptosyl)LPS alpha-1,3-glucosyltransferase